MQTTDLNIKQHYLVKTFDERELEDHGIVEKGERVYLQDWLNLAAEEGYSISNVVHYPGTPWDHFLVIMTRFCDDDNKG